MITFSYVSEKISPDPDICASYIAQQRDEKRRASESDCETFLSNLPPFSFISPPKCWMRSAALRLLPTWLALASSQLLFSPPLNPFSPSFLPPLPQPELLILEPILEPLATLYLPPLLPPGGNRERGRRKRSNSSRQQGGDIRQMRILSEN